MQPVIRYSCLAALLLFFACKKEFTLPVEDNKNRPINFQAPMTGQENLYARFIGSCDQPLATGDTLSLRITRATNDSLYFEESYSAGSTIALPEPFRFRVKWSKDHLIIPPDIRQRSQLFYFYGSDTLRLSQSPLRELQQTTCLVRDGDNDFIGDYIGSIPRFEVGELAYHSKKIVSCVPMILALNGYLVYDPKNLYASYTFRQASPFGPPILKDQEVIAFALLNNEE